MDDRRFDVLTRAFTVENRRTLLGKLAGAALGSVLGGTDIASAKKRKRKGKRKKQRRIPTPCTPNCASKACGDDGCGGACGGCGDGLVCLDGACRCPPGRELCQGACLTVCPPFQARNPETCRCCQTNLPIACGSEEQCCSGNCANGIACVGRTVGSSCTFDAQCGGGSCVDGRCDL